MSSLSFLKEYPTYHESTGTGSTIRRPWSGQAVVDQPRGGGAFFLCAVIPTVTEGESAAPPPPPLLLLRVVSFIRGPICSPQGVIVGSVTEDDGGKMESVICTDSSPQRPRWSMKIAQHFHHSTSGLFSSLTHGHV
ncbi:hypothetical protein EYF80_023438 [Liparis tanakae]|uniref:Uncharacterized protein n=1 Tax=Liparis tanakae TaxID=230148 RepID=A0A4Z2HNH5_9TELE|nr:hypothetical protein EYF80_023438 [Liparis tanakae]